MDNDRRALYFAFFNEIGIIEQLSRTAFEARLPDGVTVAGFSVLNHLVRRGDGSTPLALARAFQVPKTTMTGVLAGLESRGLVATRPNPADRRSKCVWLTDDGKGFRDDAIALLDPDLESFAAAFPPAVIADLVPRLAEIRVMLDSARDGRPEPPADL